MRRQDQQRLDQRYREHADHHHRDRVDDLAQHPGGEHQRHKGERRRKKGIKQMLRKARVSDVKSIHRLINSAAAKGEMLSRSLMDIYGSLRDFYVYYDEEKELVAGVCAMNIIWENLAEIRSLCVEENYRARGIGRNLVEACISEAITLGLFRVFTLTYKKELFAKLGFREVDRATLPEKIWSDCFRCPKYPDYCDETAMIMEL